MSAALKRRVRALVPLPARMRAAAWLGRQRWLPVADHVGLGLVRDLQTNDPKAFHKFVWANHLMGYARWYDSEHELFAGDQMQPSRIELFADLLSVLKSDLALEPSSISSILEIGCSQGYLLRHLEANTFRQCRHFVGLDIDAPAIEKGKRYLASVGSHVELLQGDMEDLEKLVGHRRFDVTMAAGVLSYLNQEDATAMVARLLARTGRVCVLAGLACTDRHNSALERSVLSPGHEGQWIHNFEAMIAAAGGRTLRSRWEGAKLYNLQTICFAFGVPGEPRLP
jgi:SAM-dependent methyltransferase